MEIMLARALVPVIASSPSAATVSTKRNVPATMIIQIVVVVPVKAFQSITKFKLVHQAEDQY